MFHSLLGGGVLVVVVVVVLVVVVLVGDEPPPPPPLPPLPPLLDEQTMLNVAVCPGFTVCWLGDVIWQLIEPHLSIEILNVSAPLTLKLPEPLNMPTASCP
jgi:hypothetical protein